MNPLIRGLALPALLLFASSCFAQDPDAARRNLVIGTAAAVAEVPPRTIADIRALLDQYKPDPARVAALKAQWEVPPPPNGDAAELSRYYDRRSRLAEELGMNDERLAALKEALRVAQGQPDEGRHVIALANGEMRAGNHLNASRGYESVLSTGKFQGGPLVTANLTLVRIYAAMGDQQNMQLAFRRGDAVLEKVRNAPPARPFVPAWLAMREWARGEMFFSQGKLGESEAALRRSVAGYEQALKQSNPLEGGASDEGYLNASGRLVTVLAAQGKLQEAELLARGALRTALTLRGKYTIVTGITLARFSDVLNEQGRFAEGAAMADAALDIFDKSGASEQSVFRSVALSLKGNSLIGLGDWPAAARTFSSIRGRTQGDEVAQKMFSGTSSSLLAQIKAGNVNFALPNAKRLLDQTVAAVGPNNPKTGEYRGVYAMALYASRDLPAALREFRESTRVLLAPGAAATELSGLALRRVKVRQIIESYLSLLHEISDTDIERAAKINAASESFRMADALLGEGSVQQALAASAARSAVNQPGLGELIREEQDGKQEIATLYDHLLRLTAAPADQQLPKVMADMRTRIADLEKSRQQLYATIEKRYPDYATLVNPRPGTLEDAAKALRPGEALISILSTAERSFVWAVNSRGEASFKSTALGEKELAAIVARLRTTLDPGGTPLTSLPAYDFAGAYRIYRELLAPAEKVWGSAQTLVFSVGGALAQIPLGILTTSAPVAATAKPAQLFAEMASADWLIKKAAIVDVPSVAAFARLRSLPAASSERSAFAGFGDPQFGKPTTQVAGTTRSVRLRNLDIVRVGSPAAEAVPAGKPITAESSAPDSWTDYGNITPLPDTREEILAIAQALGADLKTDVFLGPDASKRRVMSANLDRRRIVAFATHGLIPGDLPGLLQPALALAAMDDPKDSPLLTLDDVLDLKLNADWVVLSACNTAAGDGEGAEAVSGLGRGFFYAGTRALLVTHWPVETVSARKLTTRIFERYAKEPTLTRAQALRSSMLALMEEQGPGYSYAHPLFWAPYALIGDGGR